MNRGQDLSVQSAPEAVTMSRTPSTFAVADDHFGGSNCTMLGTDWYSSSTSNYALNSTAQDPRSYTAGLQHLPQLAEVDVDVYDPSDYLSTLPDQTAFTSLQNDVLYSQYYGNGDKSLSPSTPELCSDSNSTGQLSRQSSIAAPSLNNAFDLVRIKSDVSFCNSDFGAGLSPTTYASSEKANGSPIALTESQQSHLLSYCDFMGEQADDASPQFPSAVVTQPSFLSHDSFEEMDRSLSEESSISHSSNDSRVHRRHQEQIAQGARPIAPKSDKDAVASLQQQSDPQMLRIESQDGTTRDVAMIKKAPYVRPQHPKIKCKHCNEYPEGFRGEHELRRHTERVHATMRKVWITVDMSPDKKLLSNCKACRNGKRYHVYYNAAAHLRRAHFNPRKRGRKCKGDEKRGGKAGGNWPAMDWLKQQGWLREVEELVPEEADDKSSRADDDDGCCVPEQVLCTPPLIDPSPGNLQESDAVGTAAYFDLQAASNDSFGDFNAIQFDPLLASTQRDNVSIPPNNCSMVDMPMFYNPENTDFALNTTVSPYWDGQQCRNDGSFNGSFTI